VVDLIYARASSTPGPGSYTPDLNSNEDWGYRTMKNFQKKGKPPLLNQKDTGSDSLRSSHIISKVKVGSNYNKNPPHETMASRVKALNSLAIDSGLDHHDSFENSKARDTKTSFQSQGSIFRSRSNSNPGPTKIICQQDKRPLIIQPHYSQETDNLIVSHNRQLI
jgi:hypothetical protein